MNKCVFECWQIFLQNQSYIRSFSLWENARKKYIHRGKIDCVFSNSFNYTSRIQKSNEIYVKEYIRSLKTHFPKRPATDMKLINKNTILGTLYLKTKAKIIIYIKNGRCILELIKHLCLFLLRFIWGLCLK